MQDPAPATDTLATADFAGLFQSVGGPLLGLIVVVVIGWFGIVRIRRWMKGEAESNEPFTLNDLRTLRSQGKLSEEEFVKARDAMIGAVRSSSKPVAATKPAPTGKHQVADADKPAAPQAQRPQPDGGIPPMTPPTHDGTSPPKSPKRPPQLG
jgi:hypothetical protein